MTNVGTALISAYRNNIHRYNRLLQTHLTEIERQYIQTRLLDYQSALRALVGREIEHSLGQDGGMVIGERAVETTQETCPL